jgi:aerobic-type carbon monoxide dehydrogenase small subunit (CoxS/CutS family)
VRTRDYCTTPKHIITMCLNAVRVAVEMSNFMHVSNYVSKAEQTPGTKVGCWVLFVQQQVHRCSNCVLCFLFAHHVLLVVLEET